ncbi:nucleoside deaminase [bacterium]|nr:nucleoside deaminase [bacterium]
MHEALALARQAAERQEVPVGALLVCGGQVIGSASNRREETGRATAHAEILALEDYSQRTGQWRVPPGTSLWVTVEPCLMCTGALIWARVSEIHYGCPDPKQAGLRTLLPLIQGGAMDHKFDKVSGGIEEQACAELMKAFFQRRRAENKSTPSINA